MKSLSGLERYFYSRSHLQYHSCFFLAIKLNNEVSISLINAALRQTIARFPQLYSNVHEVDGALALKPLKHPILSKDVLQEASFASLNEDSVNSIFQKINFPYHVERPLWKILLLQDRRTLVLCADHVIMDGLSTVAFWRTFLSNLNSPQKQDNSTTVLYRPNGDEAEVPQHPYDLIRYSFVGLLMVAFVRTLVLLTYFGIDTIGKIFSPELTDKDFKFPRYQFPRGLLTSGGEVRNDNCQFNLHIPASKMPQLLSQCKVRTVSLTSLLVAAIAHALARVPPSEIQGTQLKIAIPINTRSFVEKATGLDPHLIEFGNFIKGAEISCDTDLLVNLWQTAVAVGSQLTAQRHDVRSLQLIKLMEFIDVEKFIQTKASAKYPGSTFEITNIGFETFGCGQDDKYWVEDAYFNQPQGFSNFITCSTVTTPVGGLNCCFSYPRDLENELGPVMDALQTTLNSLADGDELS
ncbi:LADA_0H18910g1_1 [Lachancea dasiensis]|uniref:LADA_0H18910g1_1 n=1 Tax=Lachancea dasiensis TaxID=1072105 RepID=A0A1G4K621_9SACH|nr:LADA_0H18910g1_1 [Lachancea dasiensis]